MSQDYFDSHNLRKIFEDKEAKRQEERRKFQTVRKNDRVPSSASLEGLVIEPILSESEQCAPVDFRTSLSLLRERGYTRHLRPAEVLAVLCEYEQNGNASVYASLVETMLNHVEWTSGVLRYAPPFLDVAVDPENLFYNDETTHYYADDGLIQTASDVTPVLHGFGQGWHDLGGLPDELSQALFGVATSQLPKFARKSQLFVREYHWTPLTVHVINKEGVFELNIQRYAVSRGVRAASPSSKIKR